MKHTALDSSVYTVLYRNIDMLIYKAGQENFFLKGQMVNTSGFVDHANSVTTV